MENHGAFKDFDCPEDVFEWWESNDSKKVYFEKKRQLKLQFSQDNEPEQKYRK